MDAIAVIATIGGIALLLGIFGGGVNYHRQRRWLLANIISREGSNVESM